MTAQQSDSDRQLEAGQEEPAGDWGHRTFDLVAAILGLVVLSPLLLGLAAVVKGGDGGPILYRAHRVGQGGRLFWLYKFRTMIVGADRQGPGITLRADTRVTPVGRWLRRTKLDELPQLLNVVRGDMALVGPRPEDPRYVALYTPTQRDILSVRPGMTSAASLAFRHEASLLSGKDWETIYTTEVMSRKLKIDLAYAQRRTLWSDVVLVLRTLVALVR